MIVRQLIVRWSVTLAISLVTTIVVGAEAQSEKDPGLDFATMIRELQLEVKKIKDEIVRLYAQLEERQERAERRRSLQKHEEQKQQDLEYKNSVNHS